LLGISEENLRNLPKLLDFGVRIEPRISKTCIMMFGYILLSFVSELQIQSALNLNWWDIKYENM
jgi:hypothetical protein